MITNFKQFEAIKLNIKVGDTLMGGKWKNKQVKVKKIGKDENGQITINEKPLLNFRIWNNLPQTMKDKFQLKESQIEWIPMTPMTKTIKENSFKYYWKLKNDEPYFKKQLEKINCPKTNFVERLKKIDPNEFDYVFVGCNNTITPIWLLNVYNISFMRNGFEYKGIPQLTPEEIKEIELEKAIKKYNL